jgi:hypothetical protein
LPAFDDAIDRKRRGWPREKELSNSVPSIKRSAILHRDRVGRLRRGGFGIARHENLVLQAGSSRLDAFFLAVMSEEILARGLVARRDCIDQSI